MILYRCLLQIKMYLVLKYIHHIDLEQKEKNEKMKSLEYNNTLSPDIRYRPNREEGKVARSHIINRSKNEKKNIEETKTEDV